MLHRRRFRFDAVFVASRVTPNNSCGKQKAVRWTDEQTDKVKRLWAAGESASQIAGQLGGGISRNAVIGKIHRLGLSGRSTATRIYVNGVATSRLRRISPTRPDRLSALEQERREARSAIAVERHENQIGPDLVIPIDQRKTLMDLERGDCRWPYGTGASNDPYYYCCHKATPGLSYCTFHAARAYQPPQVRARNEARATPALRYAASRNLTYVNPQSRMYAVDPRSLDIHEKEDA